MASEPDADCGCQEGTVPQSATSYQWGQNDPEAQFGKPPPLVAMTHGMIRDEIDVDSESIVSST